jgi:DNA transposition AAA+ family ATPase
VSKRNEYQNNCQKGKEGNTMNETIKNEAAILTPLAVKVNERLRVLCINKQMIGVEYHCSRSMISQYLSGKYRSNPETVEKILTQFLEDTEVKYQEVLANDPQAVKTLEKMRGKNGTPAGEQEMTSEKHFPEKKKVLESVDYLGVLSVCQSCQDDMGLGIIIGKSGYGKTYALKQYAKMPRVAYMECDDTMSCRDLVDALEMGLGMPKATSGTIWKRVNRIREFLNINTGYLIIVDEADKLINKYTAAKMEILRGIFDQSEVGIVIAGEPKLESDIKTVLERFANRIDFCYKLKGLTAAELKEYLKGWDIEEDAAGELAMRAFSARSGCFRLLDRTINNILRVLKAHGEYTVTLKTVQEASGMMML